jgi:hypothetical protein
MLDVPLSPAVYKWLLGMEDQMTLSDIDVCSRRGTASAAECQFSLYMYLFFSSDHCLEIQSGHLWACITLQDVDPALAKSLRSMQALCHKMAELQAAPMVGCDAHCPCFWIP